MPGPSEGRLTPGEIEQLQGQNSIHGKFKLLNFLIFSRSQPKKISSRTASPQMRLEATGMVAMTMTGVAS